MCLFGARRRPCPELMLRRTRTSSRTSASCITSRWHSKSEQCCYATTGPGRYAWVPRPSRPDAWTRPPVRVGGPTRSSARKLNQGDLRRRAQAQRRPPVARAAAHVQPHRLQPVESRDKRLEQPHQEVEREVLPTVRVPRELQVVPGGACRKRALRLMRQEHPHVALRRPRDRRRRIGGMSGEAAAREVRDSGEDDPPSSPADQLVPIDECAEAEPLQLAHPAGCIPVVLMVPPDEELPGRR